MTATGREVTLTISDNGRGFLVEQARRQALHGRSMGILGMEERAALVGGTARVESDDRGTTVTVVIPRPGA